MQIQGFIDIVGLCLSDFKVEFSQLVDKSLGFTLIKHLTCTVYVKHLFFSYVYMFLLISYLIRTIYYACQRDEISNSIALSVA